MAGFDPDRDHRLDRVYACERDDADPVLTVRERFDVPGELYLDGNSLGPVSDAAADVFDCAVEEWRDLGIEAWTEADWPWFYHGESLGAGLAPLVGTFLDARGDRPPGVLVDELEFPTDHYAIRAQLRQRGFDPDVGIVFMPSALYPSGQLLDVERITGAAHEHGALAGFDLAHSVGVVPHNLSAHGVDFAVWCSYKYLNAGPGAIAGLYVAERHFGTEPALASWWGHQKETQFEMREEFTPGGAAATSPSNIPRPSGAYEDADAGDEVT